MYNIFIENSYYIKIILNYNIYSFSKGVDDMNLNTLKKFLLYLAYGALIYFAIKLLISLFV